MRNAAPSRVHPPAMSHPSVPRPCDRVVDASPAGGARRPAGVSQRPPGTTVASVLSRRTTSVWVRYRALRYRGTRSSWLCGGTPSTLRYASIAPSTSAVLARHSAAVSSSDPEDARAVTHPVRKSARPVTQRTPTAMTGTTTERAAGPKARLVGRDVSVGPMPGARRSSGDTTVPPVPGGGVVSRADGAGPGGGGALPEGALPEGALPEGAPRAAPPTGAAARCRGTGTSPRGGGSARHRRRPGGVVRHQLTRTSTVQPGGDHHCDHEGQGILAEEAPDPMVPVVIGHQAHDLGDPALALRPQRNPPSQPRRRRG